jgi:hypothetical protein
MFSSVVVVVLCVEGSLLSSTVVQADSVTKAAAARPRMMNVFINF